MTAAFSPGDLVYARGRMGGAAVSGRRDIVPPATVGQRSRPAVPGSCARARAGAAGTFRNAGPEATGDAGWCPVAVPGPATVAPARRRPVPVGRPRSIRAARLSTATAAHGVTAARRAA